MQRYGEPVPTPPPTIWWCKTHGCGQAEEKWWSDNADGCQYQCFQKSEFSVDGDCVPKLVTVMVFDNE